MSTLKRLADEDYTTVRADFDPERIEDEAASENDLLTDDDKDAGLSRAHYGSVKESSIRKVVLQNLGPRYKGAAVSRDELDDSDDGSDDLSKDSLGDHSVDRIPIEETAAVQLGVSANRNTSEVHRSSRPRNPGRVGKSKTVISTITSSASTGDASDENVDWSPKSNDPAAKGLHQPNSSAQEVFHKNDFSRKALLEIARNDSAHLMQDLAHAIRTDAGKGKAVRLQQRAFQSLLSSRIRLQRGLSAVNTAPVLQRQNILSPSDRDVTDLVERAALSLLNSIKALQTSFLLTPQMRSKKRSYDEMTNQSNEEISRTLEEFEHELQPLRWKTLDRWAEKTAPPKSIARLDTLQNAYTRRQLSDSLESQLTSLSYEKMLSRTLQPHSRIHRQGGNNSNPAHTVYNDTDWYALLLQDLVENKMNSSEVSGIAVHHDLSSLANVNILKRESKVHRADVDVKASKGRKLRFTVHDKLQNFMAPEDRTSWGLKQAREFFGSLMGGRIKGGLDEDGEISDISKRREEGREDVLSKKALRLF